MCAVLKFDVDVEQMYERRPLRPLYPTPYTLLITIIYNIYSKFHFDFRFPLIVHENHALYPDCAVGY